MKCFGVNPGALRTVRAASDFAQHVAAHHADIALLHSNQTVLRKLREGLTHRLQPQAKKAPNLRPRLAQHQLRLPQSACLQAVNQVDQNAAMRSSADILLSHPSKKAFCLFDLSP